MSPSLSGWQNGDDYKDPDDDLGLEMIREERIRRFKDPVHDYSAYTLLLWKRKTNLLLD